LQIAFVSSFCCNFDLAMATLRSISARFEALASALSAASASFFGLLDISTM
jgi:hypothetical protein